MRTRPQYWFALIAAVGGVFLLHHRDRSSETVELASVPPRLPGAQNSGVVSPGGFDRTTTSSGEAASGSSVARKNLNAAFAHEFEATVGWENPAQRARMLDALFQAWVVSEPSGAATFVLAIENEDLRKECMLRVMQTWGVQDAAKALAWANEAPFDNAYERGVATSMVCTQVAGTDPAAAIRLALEHKLHENSHELLEGLAARWAESDLPSARAWANAQPAGESRDLLTQSIALVVFDTSPAQAAQFVLEQIPTGESQDRAVFSLLNKLAFRNLDAAWAWAKSFPEGELRNRALRELDGIQNRQIDG